MSFLERQFKITEAGSSIKTEILAGITTFVTMSYIIFVNPDILSKTGMDFNALVVATCLSSAIATFLMAFMANYPIGLAPGMGLNAFFAFSVVLGMQISWKVALTAVFIEGIIFILLTLTKLREEIVNAIPKSLKIGIAGGIGVFIAFIGLQSAGIVVKNDATLVALGHFKNNLPAALALGGLLLMAVLQAYRVTGALLIGILAVTAASVGLGMTQLPTTFVSQPPSLAPIFWKMDFSMLKSPDFWIIVFTFFFVDFFDTVGTLVGVCSRSGLCDEDGRLPNAKGALMADAIGTVAGAVLGTSTVTSYVESASGVAQGGRTGLSALVTAILFVAAIFFVPIVGMVPAYATAPALILVGIYMMMGMQELNFNEWTELLPALLAFIMMPLAYSISVGIEFGIVSFVLIKAFTGKSKEISPVMWLLAILFILKEALA
ncbi:MAG: NCS2 family permease [Fretibacterium sp.]|nr:NCS2 family permease [Fretibacterium sp.]